MMNIGALTAATALAVSLFVTGPAFAQRPNFGGGGFHQGGGGFHGGRGIGAGAVRSGFGGGAWHGGAAGFNRGGWQGRSMAGVNRGQAFGAGAWRGGGVGANRGGWQARNLAGINPGFNRGFSANRSFNRGFVANRSFNRGFQNRGYYTHFAHRRFNRNAIVIGGLGLGYDYPYYGYNYGYPDDYGYDAYPYSAEADAPLTMGRSVATGELGNHCATPQKTCVLYNPSDIGGGCSCRVPGGRARGTVAP